MAKRLASYSMNSIATRYLCLPSRAMVMDLPALFSNHHFVSDFLCFVRMAH